MKVLIVIPARYGSTRFPGKPLAKIGGVAMIDHTCASAKQVSEGLPDCHYVVATDDPRIESHCQSASHPVVMTDPNLPSGSDRAMAACRNVWPDADVILNLQGDAPFTPTTYLKACLAALREDKAADIATPVVQLSWEALDQLRLDKEDTPFSGTTAIVNPQTHHAYWFSKNIMPAIRTEDHRRTVDALSPVLRHVGLYAFRRSALEQFVASPESRYEQTEGLEQLRALELGMTIHCTIVPPAPVSLSGIDTPQDLARAEVLLKTVEGSDTWEH